MSVDAPEGIGHIDWADFQRVQICAGTVTRVEAFPEARKPAWKLWVDFGPHGIRKTSAQIVDLYDADGGQAHRVGV